MLRADMPRAHRTDTDGDVVNRVIERYLRGQIATNQITINLFFAGLPQHAWRNIDPVDGCESLFDQFHANQAGTTTVIDNIKIALFASARQRLRGNLRGYIAKIIKQMGIIILRPVVIQVTRTGAILKMIDPRQYFFRAFAHVESLAAMGVFVTAFFRLDEDALYLRESLLDAAINCGDIGFHLLRANGIGKIHTDVGEDKIRAHVHG